MIDKEKLPRHVAIIMDGNGRWAKRRALPRVEGHIAGIESVREIITVTHELEIPYLTLYAFSKENWTRPKDEVRALMSLLGIYIERELPLMREKQIRFATIGAIHELGKRLQRQLEGVTEETAGNKALHLNLALSYSGREEVLRAARLFAEDYGAGKRKRISEKVFETYLYTKGTPDPDLLIRTSGEMRLSNFLLWQLAYTEIYVTRTLWPDFRRQAYMRALAEFAGRERRFGSLKEDA
jgi:undecaprenyl diphosphate synthase